MKPYGWKLGILAAVTTAALLSGCAGGDTTGNTTKTDAATETPVSTVETERHTATGPAALRLEELPNPGSLLTIRNPDGSIQSYQCRDFGTDGRTETMNYFDADGALTAWVAYEYDGDRLRTEYFRTASGELTNTVRHSYGEDGSETVTEERADGTRSEQWFRPDGTQQRYTAYYANGNLETVMEYDESGEQVYFAVYSEDGLLIGGNGIEY